MNVNRLLIAGALASTMTAGVAQAADFGGAYVGGQLGYAMGSTKITEAPCVWWCQNSSTQDDSFSGGVRGGYNWTSGSLLYGVTAEYNWTGVDTYKAMQAGTPTNTTSAGTNVDALGSIRARLGFVSGDMAIYATGGWAYGKMKDRMDEPSNPFHAAGDGKSSGTVFGFGADYALNRQWILGVEYSAYRFGSSSHTEVSGAMVESFKTKVDVVGVNVNYKF
jgi:outer membrane immunogenic protein